MLHIVLLVVLLSSSSGAVRRQSTFHLQYAVLLDRSLCHTEVNWTCSHVTCAMYCLHKGTWCTSFAYHDDLTSCTCSLCEDIDQDWLQAGDGVVGFMENKEVGCPDPLAVLGAEVTYTATSEGAVATYDCMADHTYIAGTQTSVCGQDGQWSPVSIQCVLTGCYYWDEPAQRWLYDGHVNVTASGVTCQGWSDVTPHMPPGFILDELRERITGRQHYLVSTRLSISPADVSTNYCRSLGGEQVPWCYTTDPLLLNDYCHVPACPPPPLAAGK